MHPEWLDVGREVEVARGWSVNRIMHRHRGVVVRQTKTAVVLSTGEKFRRVDRGYGNVQYQLTPRYINYFTFLRPLERAS